MAIETFGTGQGGLVNNAMREAAAQGIAGAALAGANSQLGSFSELISTAANRMQSSFGTFIGSGTAQLQYYNPAQQMQAPNGAWRMEYPAIEITQPEYTITRFPTLSKPRRKKIAKIKKNATEVDVAKAIAKHTKTKAKQVANQTNVLEATVTSEEQKLLTKKRELETAKNRISFYKAQKARLTKTKQQIESEFVQAVTALKQMTGVSSVTIDDKGRIIVTTAPLFVQKKDWLEPKEAGVYQLRIDFSQTNISAGVRVLNTTHISGGVYDSPTIKLTTCCWGNIKKDIDRDFHTQNMEELITDMIEYISSPFEQNGYLGLNGDQSKGWEQFFNGVEPRAKDYSWEAFDREFPEREPEEGEDGPERTISLENMYIDDGLPQERTLNNSLQDALQVRLREMEYERNRLREEVQAFRPVPQSPYENELWYGLRHVGLREEAIAHYFRQILTLANAQAREFRLDQADHHAYRMRVLWESGAEAEAALWINEIDIEPGRVQLFHDAPHLPWIVSLHGGEVWVQQSPRIQAIPANGENIMESMPLLQIERIAVPPFHLDRPSNAFHNPYNIGTITTAASTIASNTTVNSYLDMLRSQTEVASSSSALTETNLEELVRRTQGLIGESQAQLEMARRIGQLEQQQSITTTNLASAAPADNRVSHYVNEEPVTLPVTMGNGDVLSVARTETVE